MMQRRLVFALVLFGEWCGREDRSCIDWPTRYRSTHLLTVGHETWNRAATSLIGPTVMEDEAGDLQPVAWCESGVWVCYEFPRRRKGASRIRLTPSGTCGSVGSRSR